MVIKSIISAGVMLVVFFYTYEYFWGTQELKKPLAFVLGLIEAALSLGFMLIIFNTLEGKINLGKDGFKFIALAALMSMGGLLSVSHKSDDEEMEEIYQAESANQAVKACPFCGKQILEIAERCRYCGSSLVEDSPKVDEDSPQSTEAEREVDIVMDIDRPGLAPNPEELPQEEIDRRSAVWISGILLVLSLLAGLLYLLKR